MSAPNSAPRVPMDLRIAAASRTHCRIFRPSSPVSALFSFAFFVFLFMSSVFVLPVSASPEFLLSHLVARGNATAHFVASRLLDMIPAIGNRIDSEMHLTSNMAGNSSAVTNANVNANSNTSVNTSSWSSVARTTAHWVPTFSAPPATPVVRSHLPSPTAFVEGSGSGSNINNISNTASVSAWIRAANLSALSDQELEAAIVRLIKVNSATEGKPVASSTLSQVRLDQSSRLARPHVFVFPSCRLLANPPMFSLRVATVSRHALIHPVCLAQDEPVIVAAHELLLAQHHGATVLVICFGVALLAFVGAVLVAKRKITKYTVHAKVIRRRSAAAVATAAARTKAANDLSRRMFAVVQVSHLMLARTSASFRHDLEGVIAQRDLACVERDELAARRNTADAERDEAIAQSDMATADRAKLVAELELRAGRLAAMEAERDAALLARDAAIAAKDQVAATAQMQLAAVQQDLAAVNAELTTARSDLATTRSDLDATQGQLATARADIAKAEAKLVTVYNQYTRAEADAAVARTQVFKAEEAAAHQKSAFATATASVKVQEQQIAELHRVLKASPGFCRLCKGFKCQAQFANDPAHLGERLANGCDAFASLMRKAHALRIPTGHLPLALARRNGQQQPQPGHQHHLRQHQHQQYQHHHHQLQHHQQQQQLQQYYQQQPHVFVPYPAHPPALTQHLASPLPPAPGARFAEPRPDADSAMDLGCQ